MEYVIQDVAELRMVDESPKKNIVIMSIHYPMSIASYFIKAWKKRYDCNVITVGAYTGANIPWGNGGMTLAQKYANPPTISLGSQPQVEVPYGIVKTKLDAMGIVPDMVINFDAACHWQSKPNISCPIVTVATDPHCINGDKPRAYSSHYFNMQACYMKPGDIYLPYAFSPNYHYYEPMVEKDYDGALLGVKYDNRIKWVNALRGKGYKILFETGHVWEEYREQSNRAYIGMSWSSQNDLIARVFETMAMQMCPILNRVPDLPLHFEEGVHYLGFDNLTEAVEKFEWAVNNRNAAMKIAKQAYDYVWQNRYTYDDRVDTIMERVFA
jgi:hypothetical protein